MKKNQFKKLVSTVTVASILGTSIATPFNVLTEQAQAAEGIQATAAPVYTLQNTNEFADYSASHSKENVYITWVTVSANTMWIDMTKFYKNYGIQITMPDGEIITKYKTINTGVSDSISVDLKGRRAGVVQIRTLTPSGGFERPGIAKVTLTAIDNSALLAYGQAVYGLFSDATFTKIGTGITQANIDAAKSKATSVPTSTEKTRLTNLITTAQTQLDTTTHTDAQNAVNALFTNDTPSSGSIKAATNQQAINNAQALINKVTDANKRAALQTNLNKAQELLNARLAAESAEAAATNAVNSLFTGGNPAASSILSTTNQTAINNAQNLINKVADPSKKAVLQTNLDKAQRLLNERTAAETEAAAEAARQTAATNAVNGLFTSNSPATNSILTATNQTAINNAQNLVNQVKNTTKKAELQGNLDKAQQLLNDRNAASEDLARQTAATNAVNGLFTSNSPATNSILAATNQTAINNAQNLVNQVKNTTKKAELQGNLDKAQQLLNDRNATSEDLARQEAARKAFNDLFVGNNHTSNVLKPSTDFMAIFNAYQLIKDVKDPAVVAELESIYGKAVNLLNARNEEEAEAARQANAEKAVNDLFTLSNPATNSILATTNQTSINAAQNLINQVKNATKKAALQLNLNKAQQLLNDRNTAAADLPNQEAARKALNELFLANNPATNMLKPAVTLADITIAGNLLDKVKDPTVKAELQGLYDKAANLYVARQEALAEQARQTAAEKAVNELFVGYNPAMNVILEATDQVAIDKAQLAVNAVRDPLKKAEYQASLDKAKELLKLREEALADLAKQTAAEKAVNELFTDNKPSTGTVKDTTTQTAIDNAQKEINEVKDTAKKNELQTNLDKAQDLLDAKNEAAATEKEKQEAAEKAVNELFNNNNPESGAIKDTTNQKAIDDAQKAIDAVKDTTKKNELQADLDKAKELLAEKNEAAEEKAKEEAAEKAVNELFSNNNPESGAIKDTTNQTAIDDAQKAIDAVKDTTKKNELQADLDKAKELLAEKNEAAEEKAKEEAAEKAVNELFNNNNPESGAIKDTTNQKAIDDAQKAIDAVKDTTKKNELQADLDKAKELLDAKNEGTATERAAEKAVNELFKNDNPASDVIKDTTTQTAIDDAQKAIDAVEDTAKKAVLQADLDKAQSLLTAKNEEAAEKARQEAAANSVKDLFNNSDVNGTIKDATNQVAIGNTQKVIDAVKDLAKRAELQAQLDKAQAQLNARNPISGVVTKYTEGNLYITGTYTGAVTGLSIDINGKRYYGGEAKDGKIKFYVGDKNLKAGDVVVVNLYDASKQIQKSLPVQVVAPLKITVADYKIGDNYVTATYNDPEITKVGIVVDGTKYWGGDVKDGNVKFFAADKIKNANAEVIINFYDANNNLIGSQPVKITTTLSEITGANYKLGASNITGTFEGDMSKLAISINGTKYYGGTIAANGTYKFYVLDKKIQTTDTVIVYGYDAKNVLLTQKTVTITE